jgi:hypothetical protein
VKLVPLTKGQSLRQTPVRIGTGLLKLATGLSAEPLSALKEWARVWDSNLARRPQDLAPLCGGNRSA